MGLLDKLRAELIDIIEWVDDSRHTIAWRFPRYQNEIKNGAQLIVRPGQMAVLVHRGEIADAYEPGNYQLRGHFVNEATTIQDEREAVELLRGSRERINAELSKVIIGQKDVIEHLG